jgi:hypothetical protein
MKIAINRFATRFEPAGDEGETAPSQLETPAPADGTPSVARLEAEILARDRYIQNLAARNLLLRMRVQELTSAIKRLRRKPPT